MQQHQPLPHRPAGDRFLRTFALSLALHGAFAVTLPLLPRHNAGLNFSQAVTVSLADTQPVTPPRLRTAYPATAVTTPPVKREMTLPSPEEASSPEVPPAPETAQAQPEPQAHRSSLSLGMTRGFFRSLGDGETLRGDIREYYLTLVQRINEQWWSMGGEGVEPGRHEALVTILMRKNGEILDIRLVRSSGNPDYDRMILNALQAATPLPPLPESYAGEYFQAPIRLMAPLGLFS